LKFWQQNDFDRIFNAHALKWSFMSFGESSDIINGSAVTDILKGSDISAI